MAWTPQQLTRDANVPVLRMYRLQKLVRRNGQGTAAGQSSWLRMKAKRQKIEPDQQDDDVWSWIVIGLIFAGVSLALYGPLIWQAAHNTL